LLLKKKKNSFMRTSNRFNTAVEKLYKAFHDKTLNPDDCKQCAVGNILDNRDYWKHLTDKHGSVQLNYLGSLHQNMGKRFNGYSPIELLRIETAFLKGCGYYFTAQMRLHRPETTQDDYILFKGLCEVVSELCKLDGQKDIMDCSALFQYKAKTTNYELV